METNPAPANYHKDFQAKVKASGHDHAPLVDWTDPRLAKITRLRFLTDPGYLYYDVSYCHGVLKDGTPVRVQVPFSGWLKKAKWKSEIVEWAKRDGVNAKRLGIFDAVSTLS